MLICGIPDLNKLLKKLLHFCFFHSNHVTKISINISLYFLFVLTYVDDAQLKMT